MLINIPVEQIAPHPKNPRQDLGDLSELRDSIRTFGILQNLTVVEEAAEQYKCIIGHRRLQAAKDIGLESVPCIVSDMDNKTQLATMMMENMQREDLTPIEEAQGFQLMIDVGYSIAEICETTGLSETKVRHRVKLNELDQTVLKEKWCGENITINDLIRLEQIEDVEEKNECLKQIGTNNFEYYCKSAIDNQKRKARKEELEADLQTLGIEYKNIGDTEYKSWAMKEIAAYSFQDDDPSTLVKFEEKLQKAEKDLYLEFYYRSVTAYVEPDEVKEEVDAEEERKRADVKKRRDEWEEIYSRIREDWIDFAMGVSEAKLKKNIDVILTEIVNSFYFGMCRVNEDDLMEALGKPDDDMYNQVIEEYCSGSDKERVVFMGVLVGMIPSKWQKAFDYYGNYDSKVGEEYKAVERFLVKFGYKISDVEMQIADGSHPVYKEAE